MKFDFVTPGVHVQIMLIDRKAYPAAFPLEKLQNHQYNIATEAGRARRSQHAFCSELAT